jgi:hypothetical protein
MVVTAVTMMMTTTWTTTMMKPLSNHGCGTVVPCVQVRNGIDGAWLMVPWHRRPNLARLCTMTSRDSGVDDAAFADDGGGWRRPVTMVVVAMAPGLCWDNELGGRSLGSVIVLPATDHNNNDLLNQQSTNNGGKRRKWWWRGGGGRCWWWWWWW